jgi:hypothetical protein
MILDNFDQAIRNQTEDYWRKEIAREVVETCPDYQERQIACLDCIDIAQVIRKER